MTPSQDTYACSHGPCPTHATTSSDGQAELLQEDPTVQLLEEPGPADPV